MKGSNLVFLALFSGLALMAPGGCQCDSVVRGSGVAKMIQQELPNFDSIAIDGIGKLDVNVGPKSSISITADDNIMPLIRVKVDSKHLHIQSARKIIAPNTTIVIKVTTPDLKSFISTGLGSVTIEGVNNKDFAVAIKGAGSLTLLGKTDNFALDVSGAGSVKAYDFEAQNVETVLNGVGSVEVNAKTLLKAKVSGVGSVKYIGDPKVQANISGIGTVHKKSE